MGAMKRIVEDILEMYDVEGKSIVEIAKALGLTENEIYEVVSNYSDSFNIA